MFANPNFKSISTENLSTSFYFVRIKPVNGYVIKKLINKINKVQNPNDISEMIIPLKRIIRSNCLKCKA